jgi:hypothetical protein
MADMRDRYLPYVLNMFYRREVLELAYSARSFENTRKAREDLFGDQNNRKRYDGYLAGLLNPQIWSALEARERKLRDAIARDSKFKATLSDYDRIKRAQAEIAKNGRSRLVTAVREHSPAIFSSMRACCCAPPMSVRSLMENGSRLFVIARANRWNSSFFPTNPSMMITRFCDSRTR